MFPGTGCVIDGSHMSNFDFMVAVIDIAIDSGFEIDMETYQADLAFVKSDEDDEDRLLDILDALDWTYDEALDYLNSKLPEGLYYTVDEQSLFLEEEE